MSATLHKSLFCKNFTRSGRALLRFAGEAGSRNPARFRHVRELSPVRAFHIQALRLRGADYQSPKPSKSSAGRISNVPNRPLDPSILFDEDLRPTVNAMYLRDACDCSRCVDVSSRQRNFSFTEIPLDIQARLESVDADQNYRVRWSNDVPGFDSEHVSTYPKSRIPYLTRGFIVSALLPKPDVWDTATFESRGLWTAFDNFMRTEEGLSSALVALQRDGLIFLTNVPSQASSVSEIAERIGSLRNTFYGMTWDVRSVPDAKNVAYTSKYLGFHMDLLYMSVPPEYQLLHCLQNTCTGGESRFVDTRRAALSMAKDHPGLFDALCNNFCRFGYINDGHQHVRDRLLVEMRRKGEDRRSDISERVGPVPAFDARTMLNGLISVNWSPEFLTTPGFRLVSVERTRFFMEAVKTFATLLEREDFVYQVKMEEGTCVIFANRRVAHARNAFEMTTGERWLRGAYLDRDVVASKMRVMGLRRADAEYHESG